MRMVRVASRHVLTLLLLATARPMAAGERNCLLCGREQACQKICRLVKEERKVEIECWGVASEDFCVPGPSRPCQRHCETVCDACESAPGMNAVAARPKRFWWTDWLPGRARVYTRKKLMKGTLVKSVPSWRWVVQDVCADCAAMHAGCGAQSGNSSLSPQN